MRMHYYGTRLSENISRREPEGYLLCLNVPVARTGPQDYLPEELVLPRGPDLIPVFRSETEVFSSETNPDKLPQTDDASAQFMNAFSSVLIGYTNRGILATAPWRGPAVGSFSAGDYIENGFALWADSYDNQPDADRQAHKAMPIQCALTLSGSLESVVITVNVRV